MRFVNLQNHLNWNIFVHNVILVEIIFPESIKSFQCFVFWPKLKQKDQSCLTNFCNFQKNNRREALNIIIIHAKWQHGRILYQITTKMLYLLYQNRNFQIFCLYAAMEHAVLGLVHCKRCSEKQNISRCAEKK